MIKNYFVFTKEIGQLLIKYRKQARLSQGEVAKRCGLHTKTGYSQISRLESGRIKNPSLASIILFLKACNTPMVSFFQKLSAIDFMIEHKKIMRQVEIPNELFTTETQSRRGYRAIYQFFSVSLCLCGIFPLQRFQTFLEISSFILDNYNTVSKYILWKKRKRPVSRYKKRLNN